VEDARTALAIYKKFQSPWERNVDKYLESFDKPCFGRPRPPFLHAGEEPAGCDDSSGDDLHSGLGYGVRYMAAALDDDLYGFGDYPYGDDDDDEDFF
jgi:hypothetical protein